MLSVEYTVLAAGTLVAFLAAASALGPSVETYRQELRTSLDESRALILELEAACPAPVQ